MGSIQIGDDRFDRLEADQEAALRLLWAGRVGPRRTVADGVVVVGAVKHSSSESRFSPSNLNGNSAPTPCLFELHLAESWTAHAQPTWEDYGEIKITLQPTSGPPGIGARKGTGRERRVGQFKHNGLPPCLWT